MSQSLGGSEQIVSSLGTYLPMLATLALGAMKLMDNAMELKRKGLEIERLKADLEDRERRIREATGQTDRIVTATPLEVRKFGSSWSFPRKVSSGIMIALAASAVWAFCDLGSVSGTIKALASENARIREEGGEQRRMLAASAHARQQEKAQAQAEITALTDRSQRAQQKLASLMATRRSLLDDYRLCLRQQPPQYRVDVLEAFEERFGTLLDGLGAQAPRNPKVDPRPD